MGITAKLRSAGATIVPITDSLYNASAIAADLDTQRYEFRQLMNQYLQRPSLSGPHPKTLDELYATPPGEFLVIPSEYEYVNTALVSSTSNASWEGKPSYATVQSGRNGILAALTGSPVVTVPAGFSEATETAPEGVPIGMEILGRPWTEEKLLQIAFEIQGLGRVRKTPSWAKEMVDVREYSEVPDVTPNTGNIPDAYPLGTL